MSYHVELPATLRDGGGNGQQSGYSVGTFAGGKHGPMVQITVGRDYVQLTRKQQKKLRKVLKAAKKGSLYGYPGAH